MVSFIMPTVSSFWKLFDNVNLQRHNKLASSDCPVSSDLQRLATPADAAHLPIIQYAYDPQPASPPLLDRQLFQLSPGPSAQSPIFSLNSVKLNPLAAGLPYRCSIDHVYASKFWRTNLGETVDLLNLLAAEKAASDIEVYHGITITKLAKKALGSGLEHQMVLATHYMFPGADEKRTKQIAALMILYFVFDGRFLFGRGTCNLLLTLADKVEETPERTVKRSKLSYSSDVDRKRH